VPRQAPRPRPYRLAAQTQIIRVLAGVAAKAGIRQADSEEMIRFRQALLEGKAMLEALAP
jgi:hypothetical protein